MAPRRVTEESLQQWIRNITFTIVGSGLADDQNAPAIKRVGRERVVTTAVPVDASVLGEISYADLYAEQRSLRAYNMRLLDGGLIQLSYTFSGRRLVRHRLAYLPSPDLASYQNDPDLYLGEWLFADVVGSQACVVPVRFDYDSRPDVAVSVTHPAAHMTLGQYLHCRVPVSGPVSPAAFVDFIVRHFYSFPGGETPTLDHNFAGSFDVTITGAERSLVHIVTNSS